MANRVTIDVEARFVDRVSSGMNAAAKSSDKLEKSVEKANKELDKASKKNVKPKLGADDNAFTKKIREAQSKAEKLGKTKVAATLGAIDKASAKIGQVTGAAKAFGSKVFKGSLSMLDKASSVIGDVNGAARSFAGKTFSAAVKIKDYATAPLRKIKDSLFNIKTLIATITAGLAAKQFVVEPINLADAYSSAQIGFSTLLGESEGQSMMDDIDEFAKATPFKTSNVISNVQKMMAYGWDASRVIGDMQTIGDAAAATGKGDEGLASIVYALSEIRSKGKLSTQELNQLASAGIKAKQYLAEGLGYGTDDAGLMKLAADLEDGAIGANQAVELILQGMKEFDGMMDKTANETVKGLWGQIEDTFEINIFRKWGQGLQDGAKKGFGSIVDLLNTSDEALEDFGGLLYDVGKELSNWAAGKLDKAVATIKEIVSTDAFKDASLVDKVKMLWDGVVGNPFAKWWDRTVIPWWNDTAIPWLSEKSGKAGEAIGKGLTAGLLTLFGASDKVVDGVEVGSGIAGSFVEGFKSNFDGSAITDAFVDAISNIWDALPWWGKFLIGGYAGGKAITGINAIAQGIGNIVSFGGKVKGTTGGYMEAGTGLAGGLASLGYGAVGKISGAGAPALAGMSGGVAAAAGTGLVVAGTGAIYSANRAIDAYKGFKEGDKTKGWANVARAGGTLTGIGIGASAGAKIGGAIGTVAGPVGTAAGALIGAGLGTVVGWFAGDTIARNIEAAKFESEEMQEKIKDSEASAEELAETFERVVRSNLADRFGDIELSMEEISAKAKEIVFDEQANGMKKFSEATEVAEQSLQNFQSAAADMERLNFDLTERAWKINMGLKENLSDAEIEQVKAQVQNFIDSAEAVISDQHYQFNAAIEVLLTPAEGKDNSTYDQFITDGNTMFAQLQEELNAQTQELTAQYDIALEDGIVTADEQEILSQIQAKISEITEQISQAQTEASFTVSKLDFTMGELSAETFEQFQNSLQTQLDSYVADQKEALTIGITELNLELEKGMISRDTYDSKVQALVDGYNANIESMTARVNQVQLEGISEAFDDVGTVEEIQGAINGVLADGKNPLDVTFDDINAHLNLKDDVLSEEDRAAFTEVMKLAIQSAATGDNALTTAVEVNPHLETVDEKLEGLRNQLLTQTSVYFKGENALQTDADFHVKGNMFGTGGIPLAEEADKGRSKVKKSIDSAFEDSFSTSADANITLNWKITNPTKTLSFSGGGGNGSTVTATVGGNAAGGFISGGPQLSWLDEEGTGEVVIPFNPSRRARALELYAETGRRLGVLNHAEGGFVGGDTTPIQTYGGEIQTGSGEQKIEINMGGVTIEIKTDGDKSVAENIEDQEQEIAEKVAEIFKNVFSAQFANMPLKGGA